VAAPSSPRTAAIVFDVDDTLVPKQTLARWQWAWLPNGPVLSERHVHAALRRSLHAWDRRRWQGLVGSRPAVTVEDYRAFLRDTLAFVAARPLPAAETEAVVARFERFSAELAPFPDALPTLRALRERGVKLVALAEVPGESTRLALRRAGLVEFFLGVVGEGPEDPRPPAADAFRAAAKLAGAKPRQALYVGDLYWSDVRAAARAGLQAVLLDRNDWWFRVSGPRWRSLAELPKWLDAPPSAEAPAAGAVPAEPVPDEPPPDRSAG
jgi:FMN phosphatase YigB (HAD superfamily)